MWRLYRCLVILVIFVAFVSLCFIRTNNSSLVDLQSPSLVGQTLQSGSRDYQSPWPHDIEARIQGRKSGYVLAKDYSDQLTAGSVNILTLQCWASQLHDRVKVVEPFLRDGSYWGLQASQLHNASTPRLRDVFDAAGWRRYSINRGLSPLANWEDFLKKSPRKMILAGLGCKELSKRFHNFALVFAKVKGFQIVRQVCTKSDTVFSEEQFRSQVYGSFRPADTVVLFDSWSGISGTISRPPLRYRIPIHNLNRCERDSSLKKFMDSIPQSKKILENGRTYIERYLSSSSGSYIAVMFRLEQLFARRNLVTESGKLRGGKKCIESIVKKVAAIKNGHTQQVFLAMDSGKYGSFGFRSKNHTVVHQLSHELLGRLYNGSSMTFDDWEGSFASIADFDTPGYVAMLQLSVAVRATQLLLAGGGSFQSIAEREIRFRHQSNAKLYHVENC